MKVPCPATLPLREAAHALIRARFEEMSDAELAAVEFGPWPLADLCEVPTPKQWRIASREVPNVLLVAAKVVRNDKAGLVARTAAMEDDEGLDVFLEGLQRWKDLFRQHLAMIEAAQDRMIVAVAALHQGSVDADDAAAEAGAGGTP